MKYQRTLCLDAEQDAGRHSKHWLEKQASPGFVESALGVIKPE